MTNTPDIEKNTRAIQKLEKVVELLVRRTHNLELENRRLKGMIVRNSNNVENIEHRLRRG